MKRILLTNDDGIHAEGLHVARRLLAGVGSVVVVAPDREMSGSSHSLTLNHPLRIHELETDVFVVNGTPTDCVNLALNRVLDARPDLVFSGINPGTNVGLDVTYSGTVSAAFEGAVQGVASIAVSIEASGDPARPAVQAAILDLVQRMLRHGHGGLLLNVNIPAGRILGARCSVQGDAGFRSEIIEKLDPRGRRYYWIGGQHAHDREVRAHSDIATLRAGYVSITPLRLDLTDHAAYDELRQGWLSGADGLATEPLAPDAPST